MSRAQLALRVGDLDASIAFYTKLFGTEPAKLREGYANFAIATPPLKLVLIQGEAGQDTVMDHLGVEVETTDEVDAATTRLTESGLITLEENDTSCCYAVQDKVWVHGPGNEPWEVYVVKGDADTLTKDTDSACCLPAGTDSGVPVAAGAGESAGGCCG
ncbi:ArsI/CadI family heavy metal resistance metalloenzyme [Embleya sp. NPDC008237]|uniref:ArsI/CadI family heavy metal resistance metalloenzyme n=1 Tax=Embleya sp. NPDC008237 TaxID=3363978 RepID=UPI0036E9E7A7